MAVSPEGVTGKAHYFQAGEWKNRRPFGGKYTVSCARSFREACLIHSTARNRWRLLAAVSTWLLMAWRKLNPIVCRATFGSRIVKTRTCGWRRWHGGADNTQRHPTARLPLCVSVLCGTHGVLTDGAIDVGRAPDLYVSEQARAVPVRCGHVRREMLTDVPAFKPVSYHRASPVSDLVGQARGRMPQPRRSSSDFRGVPNRRGGIGIWRSSRALTVRSPCLDSEFMRTVYRAPSASVPRDVRRRLIADGNPALARLATDRGVSDSRTLSTAINRAWLDFTLKAEYAYDYGMPQWLAPIDRRLSWLRPERLFLGRHRMFHFRVWYRDALAPYLGEMLLDRRALARPYVNRREVETVVSGHLAGRRNYTREIHKLLSLELVHRLFADA